jgi:hypothetical protein
MSKEMSNEELVFTAMKSIWIIEGQIQTLEAYLENPPTKETSMAMLRDLRGNRSKLEKLVETYRAEPDTYE